MRASVSSLIRTQLNLLVSYFFTSFAYCCWYYCCCSCWSYTAQRIRRTRHEHVWMFVRFWYKAGRGRSATSACSMSAHSKRVVWLKFIWLFAFGEQRGKRRCVRCKHSLWCRHLASSKLAPRHVTVPHAPPAGCARGNCVPLLDGWRRCRRWSYCQKVARRWQLLVSRHWSIQDLLGVIDDGESRGDQTSNARKHDLNACSDGGRGAHPLK